MHNFLQNRCWIGHREIVQSYEKMTIYWKINVILAQMYKKGIIYWLKSVRIRSISGPYLVRMRENTDQ